MSTYAVIDPATGTEVQAYPTAADAAVDAAVAAAAEVFATWSRRTSVAERAPLVRRVGELHTERREELADIIGREMGKAKDAALGEVDFCREIHDYYADHAEGLLADQPVQLQGSGSAVIRRSPFGVLLGIMPWNYPYYQVARFAAPNLVTGNPIILKHAPQCPESAAALQSMYRDAGFPDGAYVNLYATNDQVATIIGDPRVAGVSLTGSERAGAAVAEIAGRHLKKVVLELVGRTRSCCCPPTTSGPPSTPRSRRGWRTPARHATRRSASSWPKGSTTTSSPPSPSGCWPAAPSCRRFPRRLPPRPWPSRSTGPVAEGADLASTGERRGAYFLRRGSDLGDPGQLGVPAGAVRSGRHGVQGRRRGRGDRAGQRAPRSAWVPTSSVPTPTRPRGSPTGSRRACASITGVGLEAAEFPLRRSIKRSGFGRGSHPRHRGVRQQEDDPYGRLSALTGVVLPAGVRRHALGWS